ADIYISPISVANSAIDGQLAPEIVAQIEQFDGIEQILTVRDVDLFAPALGRTVNAVAVNGDVSGGNRPILWQSAETEAIWQALLAGEGIIISEPLLRRENISIPPPPLTLLTAEGEHEFPVLAVLYDYTSDQGLIWVGSEPYRELWQDEAISSIAVVVGEAAAVDTLVTQMQTAFTRLQAVTVRSNQALRSASLEVFDRTFAITAALRLLATVVAFIGVLSTLMSLQLERARELGTLRATGMTQRQLWLLTLLETGLMGSVAGLVAMPTGYALAWILIYVINLRSFGWTLQLYLQPSYFLNAFFVAVTAALLAGIYPSIRLGRMVIASALRAE
ncbi:MAG TPA: ABC transporter permease, partial [Anaerolineae bacterium]|nr:ABC transporter permease [Anaerolineae bacterium]